MIDVSWKVKHEMANKAWTLAGMHLTDALDRGVEAAMLLVPDFDSITVVIVKGAEDEANQRTV